MKKTALLTALLTVSFFTRVSAQIILIHHSNKDTAYIKEFYRRHIVFRVYESTKFTEFKLIDGKDRLIFKPNDHSNLGIGLNYRFICLNIGFYAPFIGKNGDIYGNTHDFDLQTHLYVHRFVIDIYGAYYHGYYLSNTGGSVYNPPQHILLRPDIATHDISLVVQYVDNDKRFSYNAPFYQNERQKKSAGSLLLGGGIYHFDAKGDSALTPANTSYTDFFHNFRFNAIANSGAGFSVGYAYTQVIKKWFFITASLSGGSGLNLATLSDVGSHTEQKYGLELNITANASAGYNSDNYFAGITYIRLMTENNASAPGEWQQVSTGSFRLTVAKRFRLKKSLIPKSDLIKIE